MSSQAGAAPRQLRVLVVTDMFGTAMGGLERAVQSLSGALIDRGHVVELATLQVPGRPSTEQIEGLTVHRLPGWQRVLSGSYEDPQRPFHPTLPDPGFVRALQRLIGRFKPHIVHAHGWVVNSCTVLPRRRLPRLVGTLHDYGYVCAKKNYLRPEGVCAGPGFGRCIRCAGTQYGPAVGAALSVGLRASRPAYRRLDAAISISETVRATCASALDHTPINRVIPSPVALEAIAGQRGRRPEFVPPTGPYVMFAGDPSPHKGIDVLLAAHARLPARVPLVICATRQSPIDLGGREDVLVTFAAEHRRILDAWSHCAAAVMPSIWLEPFGLSALEAMACGGPVIASRIGGIRDTVREGIDGLLVPPGDAVLLAEAIARLLSDPTLASTLRCSARERVKQFSPDAIATAHEALYYELLNRWPI